MAERHEDRIVLNESAWMRNPFTRGLKRKFFTDGMQRIACIPFIRNILEYTKDDKDPDYLTLTSLLHWKPDTATITQARSMRSSSRPSPAPRSALGSHHRCRSLT